MRTHDPIDDLLTRAIAAVDALGRRAVERAPAVHFAVLGATRAVDRPEASIDAIVERLIADVRQPSTGGASLDRLYLAISGPLAGDAIERRVAEWRQAVVRRCPHRALYEFRVPEHADAEALWHAVDACGDVGARVATALLVTYVPTADAGTLTALVVAPRRDDAPYDATIERSTTDNAASAAGDDAEPRDALSLALADGVRDCSGDAAAPIEWISRDRRWRCTARRRAFDEPVVASDPVATALALLQRVSGYAVRDALDGGNAHMTLAVDSIMALEYAERFRAAFGRRLPVDALLDRPPLHAVVERIRACLREAGNDDMFVPLGRRRAAEGTL